MKVNILLVTVVLFLAFSINSNAIDRNAQFIDSIGAYGMSYKDGKLHGYQLWGETALGRLQKDWAVIVGIGTGTDSLPFSKDTDYINGLAGMKYYFSEYTSAAIIANFAGYDSSSDLDITSGSFLIKHRFIDATEGVSPFLTASATYRAIDRGASGMNNDELVGSAGLGCEFMLTKDLSIVLEASYLHGESLQSGGFDMKDAVLGAVYFTGYWD